MIFDIHGKRLKRAGIVASVLVLIVTALHFWFINHLKNVIEDIVRSKSNGTLELDIRHFTFNYITKRIKLQQVVFFTNDTSQPAMYRFSVKQIDVQATAFRPLLTNRLLIDSISLTSPHVQMTRIKPREKEADNDISIPEEIGRVYNSIQQALQVLNVRSFRLNDGRFTLVNRLKPHLEPTRISNIYFQIDNLLVDSSRQPSKRKILFSDNIILRTSNQDISFPNGRHRLAFNRFRINIKNKLIEIDSCTITVQDTSSGKIRSSVFIDTLKLTNIDFTALYERRIKVDSVYCANPKINLVLELKNRDSSKNKLPDPGRIIQELTGSMELAHLGISNANLNVTTINNNEASTFTADQNDFTLKGLKIDPSNAKGLTVQSFAMTIRNYENFIKDSSYAIRFDSILFVKNNIRLRNFSMISKDGGHRSFHMPMFELSGLSWDEVLFNRHFFAQKATLYQPVIRFTSTIKNKSAKKQTFFQLLASIHDVMQLNQLNIIDGQISLRLRKGTAIDLHNTNLQLNSNVMMESSRFKGMEKSVKQLQFSKGVLTIKDVLAELNHVQYTGDGHLLKVKELRLSQQRQNFSAVVKNLLLDELVVDEENDRLTADGIHWKQADITIRANTNSNSKNATALFMVENIIGNDTRLHFLTPKLKAAVFLNTLKLTGLEKGPERLHIAGFQTWGQNLEVSGLSSILTVADIMLHHNQHSVLKGFSYRSDTNNDTIDVSSPGITFTADFESMINKKFSFDEFAISDPLIYISLRNNSIANKRIEVLPEIYVKHFRMDAPNATIKSANGLSATLQRSLQPGLPDNKLFLDLHEVSVSGKNKNTVTVDTAKFNADSFEFKNSGGNTIGSDSGFITSELHKLHIEPSADHRWNWSAFIASAGMGNLVIDSMGKDHGKLRLKTAALKNLNVNQMLWQDIPGAILANPLFLVHQFNGSYSYKNTVYSWYNALFDHSKKIFSVDSASLRPVIARDLFTTGNPFQATYLTVNTGPIRANGININQFVTDSTINIKSIEIDRPVIYSYLDKRPAFNANKYRPLPATILKNISFPFLIDTVFLHNGSSTYSELSNKTLMEGNIGVTRINAMLFPIKNYDLDINDSLNIRAEGWLMDSAWMALRLKQSYTDSLGGFRMTFQMKPTPLGFLNSALEPMASVRLRSGYLDSLSMRAIGNENLSVGEMKMLYHNLKIRFLKKGSATKKDMLTGLITFIANNFIIRKQNTSRPGRVYYPRLKNRSVFNYLVKMTMSGIAGTVGARQSRKVRLQYNKELNRNPLPEIILDE